MLLVAPIAMYGPKGTPNTLVLGINTVFSLILIALGALDYRMRSNPAGGSMATAYVMLVLGFITFFLYSHFYGTPWFKDLHLYIVGISNSGAFHVSYYGSRDEMSAMSYTGGVIIILGSLYEIASLRKKNTSSGGAASNVVKTP